MTTRSEPTFDAAPHARPLFKERALWIAIMGLFFFLLYGSANYISGLTAPHLSFAWDWEKAIPFVPEMIVPYMSSDIVFVIALLLVPTRDAIQRLALRYGLATVISAAFFIAVPLEFSFQRPDVAGWTKPMFDLLSIDKPYNQFPSLHVSLGILAWHAIAGQLKGFARAATAIWFLSILASTLLVYQHHAIDLPGGIAVAALTFWLVPEAAPAKLGLRFITPRHLDMALRYLVGAAAAALLAMYTGAIYLPGAIAFAWIAISLILVAACYVLGANGFLAKTRTGYGPLIWLFYGPYILGSALGWRYWRRRAPLMSAVTNDVWVGARPGRRQWDEVKSTGIQSVVDLAPELRDTPPASLSYKHVPLLDVAIPDPAILDKVAQEIDERAKKGGVYIHCALGMSRSVLAVSAWLMRNGCTPREALQRLDAVRPQRVNRPYIELSLQLYEGYLSQMMSPSTKPVPA